MVFTVPMREHGAALGEAIAAAVGALAEPTRTLTLATLSGPDYIDLLQQVEGLGRVVDALRVRLAGDARRRSTGAIDTFGALGYRNEVEGVAALTGVSEATARARIRTGDALTPGTSLTGAPTAPAHPVIADAVTDGSLGVEAAALLVRELDAVSSRVEPTILHDAETGLVELAAGTSSHPPLRVDLVRGQVKAFIAVIDPDGARPTEEAARRQRSLRFGKETPEGLIPVSGMLMPEVGATFKRLTDAHMRAVTFTEEPVPAEVMADTRRPDQSRHDSLASVLSAASRVADAPELAGSAPAVIVTITQDALDDEHGVGSIDGLDTPVSAATVRRLADTRGTQTVTMNRAGRILSLGSTQRCFTPMQRRAITARDGGCVIPGCTIPAGWCEVHHVVPHRDGGETHTDNGVLLCWGHHQKIDTGPWRISMPEGVPHVRGPGHHHWTRATKARARPPLPATG